MIIIIKNVYKNNIFYWKKNRIIKVVFFLKKNKIFLKNFS